jgi:hypothetical protein
MESFVALGFRTGFKLARPGAKHTCPTCGLVYELKRTDPADCPPIFKNAEHYIWTLVTH